MGGGSAPKQPDPAPAAKATAEGNKEVAQYTTALDRPTQIDPYGQITWALREGANAAKPVPGDWTQTTTLSPGQQSLLDLDIAAQQKAYGIGSNALDAATAGGAGGTLNLDGLRKISDMSAPNLGQFQVPQYQQGTMGVPQFQTGGGVPQWEGMSQYGQVPGATSQGGQTAWQGVGGAVPGATSQGGQEAWQGLGNLFAADPAAFALQGQQVRDALYDQMTRFSGDRFSREEDALRTRLANQGFQAGAEGFNNEMTEFARSKDESYRGAELAAILAGGAEQSRLFSDLLAGRQQQFSESAMQRQQREAELANLYSQQMSSRQQDFSESALQRQQREAELGNLFNQQFGQRGQQFQESQYGQNAGLEAYKTGMLERGQLFDAQAQGYGMDEQSRMIAQQNAMQQYQAQLAQAQQGFQNQYQTSQWDAQRRQMELQELMLQRQTPLNEALSIGGMTGVTNPAFQNFNLSQPWQGVDHLAVQNQRYQGDVNAANYKNAQQGQTTALIGTAAMAAAMYF